MVATEEHGHEGATDHALVLTVFGLIGAGQTQVAQHSGPFLGQLDEQTYVPHERYQRGGLAFFHQVRKPFEAVQQSCIEPHAHLVGVSFGCTH